LKKQTANWLLKFPSCSVYLFFALVLLTTACQRPIPTTPPDWAYDAIWYQIFPERFRNGDTNNDPTQATLKGTWPYEEQKEWHLMPWTAEWYKLQPWEVQNGRGFYYNAQLRRYGGDLQGILEKLDYLQELGVNALYLNPIFESASAHKYGATFYHHIDNNFGPDPQGDSLIWLQENPADPATWQWTSADTLFLRLVREVHRRGMHIIIDGVFNHVGISFWAFQDVVQKGRASKYCDWFVIKKFDDPNTLQNEFEYQGWVNIPDLPEIKEDKNGPPAAFREHIRAIVKRWGDPNGDGDPSDGVDGWRLDVAEQVSKEFWQEFRQWTKRINPDAYLVGEIWWEDFFNNKMYNAAPWLKGDIFDGVMNYRFADIMLKAFVDKRGIKPSQLNNLLGEIRQQYPLPAQFVSQNLMSSHDTERFASMVANPDRWLDHACNLQYNPEFKIRPPTAGERRLQRAILVFQYAYIGAPYIYYGDEVGMWGADDPDCRKPMLWEDFIYEPETVNPFNQKQKPIPVECDIALRKFYQQLNTLRQKHEALRRGKYRTLIIDDQYGIYAFERYTSKEAIRAVFNLTDKTQKLKAVVYLAPEPKKWQLLFSVNDENPEFLSAKCARLYIKVGRGQE